VWKTPLLVLGLSLVTLQGCGEPGRVGPEGPPGVNGDPGPIGSDGVGGADGDAGTGGPSSQPSETGGSRIKARYTTTTYASSDGAKQVSKYFAGWFDAQRNEPCSVAVGADGTNRCLPASGASYYYLDAGCNQLALMWTNSVPACGAPAGIPPKYATETVVANGCYSAHIRVVGPKLTTGTYYMRAETGACYGPYAAPANTALTAMVAAAIEYRERTSARAARRRRARRGEIRLHPIHT